MTNHMTCHKKLSAILSDKHTQQYFQFRGIVGENMLIDMNIEIT